MATSPTTGSTPTPSVDVEAMRAEIAAARAENEVLLQQITRLCLFVEQRTGCDPIAVMYARGSLVGTAAPAAPAPQQAPPSVGSWMYDTIIGRPSASAAQQAPAPQQPQVPSSPPAPQPPGPPARVKQSLVEAPAPVKLNAASPQAAAAAASPSESASIQGAHATPEPPVDEVISRGPSLAWAGEPEAIEELEKRLARSSGLVEMSIDGVGLARLPATASCWAHLGASLVCLSLNSNSLVELPAAFEQLQKLRRLRLESNLFRTLPAPVLRLARLQELGMGCNQLTGLPDDINALERLEDLYLVSNEISFLPHTLGALSRLRRLELSANALYELPRSVANLRALESLWLSSNSLATFPQQLCALDNLTTLDLQSNRLTSVPRTVGTMPALTTLLLGGNPLVYPPAGVVAQGPPAVLEYIRSHRQSDLLSSASERSVQQVAAYRDRLTSSTAGVLEERRQQQRPPPPPQKRMAPSGMAPPGMPPPNTAYWKCPY